MIAVGSICKMLGVVLVCALLGVLCGASPAAAEGSWWQLSSGAKPTSLAPGGEGKVTVVATNLGDGEVNGAGNPVLLSDTLPAGLTATAISGHLVLLGSGGISCSLATLSCTFEGMLPPYGGLQVEISVEVASSAGAMGSVLDNVVSVTGGGAPRVSVRRPVSVSSEPVVFGVEEFSLQAENADGSPDTQAGSHPFQLTTTTTLNQTSKAPFQAGETKDLRFNLPPGLVGNPTPLPQCTDAEFAVPVQGILNECAPDTAIGVAVVTVDEPEYLEEYTLPVPVFNLVPAAGEPARFGFVFFGVPVLLDTSVRTGGGYGVTVSVNNTTETAAILGVRVTLWGVPGDPRHNQSRGWGCLLSQFGIAPCVPYVASAAPPSFLTLPTSCSGPLRTTVEADSWAHPGSVVSRLYTSQYASGEVFGLDGCNRELFAPSLSATPDGTVGSTPTGLTTSIHVPQETLTTANGLAESAVRETTFTLPAGMQLSPAAGDGLLACSTAEFALESHSAPACPEASKVATVEIKTPLLPEALTGSIYLATQEENPFGSLVALYLYAEDPTAGVIFKLPGKVSLDPVTGQITTVFPNSPDLPFSELNAHFFGSDRAPLSTPPLCGSYTSVASLVPWSGNVAVGSSSTFDITSGPDNTPCASPRPFQPGFEAGTTSVQAGGYSPLTLTMDRPDTDQTLGKLSVVFPPGVSAGLQGVKLCEEPQAAAGQCPAESQIGQVTASAGLGGDPYPVETGKAYITGPYEGDPFGVEIVVPAVAGPFNLGTEIVRAKIDVDPTDAHLTVVSDPLPTILDGIPLQIQHVNVTVNRPGFVFNPTSCEPMKITGELESTEGAKADVATPFQVTNCAALSFKPEFKVSTSAHTSRVDGVSLHVDLTLPKAPQGTQANVAKVKVSLPKQLPSPLKTLQKACLEKVFAENPSSCPVASKVGEAHVSTPVLEGGLSGPAYFVSHGGAKYPELIIVLTGEDGVTVQVHGETFISKQGITSATFNTVPDVPFSGFELTLPQREYPAVTANGNLCKGTLIMPTELVGQNGAKINQETKISVMGCPPARPKAKKVSHKKKGKHGHAKRRRAGHNKKKG